MAKDSRRVARLRRHARVRAKVKGTSSVPRLCVFRSPNHIYAQIIDDTQGHTLAAASTLDTVIKDELNGKTKTGKPYQNDYCQIWRFENGLATEFREYLDTQLAMDVFFKG